MKKTSLFSAIALISVALLGFVLFPQSSAADKPAVRVLSVYEVPSGDVVVDLGAPGDSIGDMIVFDSPVFDATTNRPQGRASGQCVRTVLGTAYECVWTTALPTGKIMVAGPFYDTASSTLAITGGTGDYRNAQGEMLLRLRPNGTDYDFVFRLSNDR
jgi:allene oxide cyclase